MRRCSLAGREEDERMCCEDLICARCAGPVAEGRCASCRSARASLHHGTFSVSPQVLALIIAALLMLALLAAQHAG
jgi:hypothetical protein